MRLTLVIVLLVTVCRQVLLAQTWRVVDALGCEGSKGALKGVLQPQQNQRH